MEIRGIIAVSILGARIYLRDAQSFTPGNKRFNAPRRSDGIVEEKVPRQIVDVINMQTSERTLMVNTAAAGGNMSLIAGLDRSS